MIMIMEQSSLNLHYASSKYIIQNFLNDSKFQEGFWVAPRKKDEKMVQSQKENT